jgi:hypothetical protein
MLQTRLRAKEIKIQAEKHKARREGRSPRPDPQLVKEANQFRRWQVLLDHIEQTHDSRMALNAKDLAIRNEWYLYPDE